MKKQPTGTPQYDKFLNLVNNSAEEFFGSKNYSLKYKEYSALFESKYISLKFYFSGNEEAVYTIVNPTGSDSHFNPDRKRNFRVLSAKDAAQMVIKMFMEIDFFNYKIEVIRKQYEG